MLFERLKISERCLEIIAIPKIDFFAIHNVFFFVSKSLVPGRNGKSIRNGHCSLNIAALGRLRAQKRPGHHEVIFLLEQWGLLCVLKVVPMLKSTSGK